MRAFIVAGVPISRRVGHSTCRRRPRYVACQATESGSENESDDGSNETKKEQNRRRRGGLSAESRAKISASLKGRRKSEQHRENLRRRFGGEQNPMYGKKRSEETRAKISRAMMEAKKRKREKAEEAKKKSPEATLDAMSGHSLDKLRDQAVNSRLLSSAKGNGRKVTPEKKARDEVEERRLEEVLDRVAKLDAPPESVKRTIRNTKKRRDVELGRKREKNCATNDGGRDGGNAEKAEAESVEKAGRDSECETCRGCGLVRCPECVGSFGVTSARCELCYGAGSVFCGQCNGVGVVSG